ICRNADADGSDYRGYIKDGKAERQMMRLCSIASGSSGNCIYVGDEDTHLLVDTGISKKRIEEGLHNLGIKGDELTGILITHEHIDHIQGLGVFSRKYEIPVYA